MTTAAPPKAATGPDLYRLTVDQYHRMADAGVFHPEDRVELLEGLVIIKHPDHWPADFSLRRPPNLRERGGPLYRLTVDQYRRMLDAGILYEGEPVELLNGLLVKKMSRKPPHDVTLACVAYFLPGLLPRGWSHRAQSAIRLSGGEPEPDGAVVRGVPTTYLDGHPEPPDIGIVIEISDTTLTFDRVEKASMYAAAGLPVYWVLNVSDRVVEMYTDPRPDFDPPAYATRTDFPAGTDLPVVLDGVVAATVPVADLIP